MQPKRKKNVNNVKKEILLKEYEEAVSYLRIAEQNFEYASPEFFEVANQELTLARLKNDMVLKKMKACNLM